jgi:hypothetical protein
LTTFCTHEPAACCTRLNIWCIALILGLFCLYIGSLLSIYWVSFVNLLPAVRDSISGALRWIFLARFVPWHTLKKKSQRVSGLVYFLYQVNILRTFQDLLPVHALSGVRKAVRVTWQKKKSRKSESWYILQSHWRGVERVLKKKKGKKPWLSKSFSARIQRRNMLSMTCMEHVGYVMYPPPHMTCILLVWHEPSSSCDMLSVTFMEYVVRVMLCCIVLILVGKCLQTHTQYRQTHTYTHTYTVRDLLPQHKGLEAESILRGVFVGQFWATQALFRVYLF